MTPCLTALAGSVSALVLVALVACSDPDMPATPAATADASTPSAASRPNTAASGVPGRPPVSASPRGRYVGVLDRPVRDLPIARTGVPEVDWLFAALAARDMDAVYDRLSMTLVPCRDPAGPLLLAQGPQCPSGVPDRTPVETFLLEDGCKRSYVRTLIRSALIIEETLYNLSLGVDWVRRVQPSEDQRWDLPGTNFEVVLRPPFAERPAPVFVLDTEGRFVEFRTGTCTPRNPRPGSEFLLPPLQ